MPLTTALRTQARRYPQSGDSQPPVSHTRGRRQARNSVARTHTVLCASRRPTDDEDDSSSGASSSSSPTAWAVTVWSKAEPVVDMAASLLPESLPRPLAKALAAVLGLGLAWWGLKSLLNTFASLLVLVGLVFAAIAISGGSASGGRRDGEATRGGGGDGAEGDDEDPLVRARRIMDKYK